MRLNKIFCGKVVMAMGLLGAMISALALFGHMVNKPMLYVLGDHNTAGMAFPTAWILLIFGLAIAFLGWIVKKNGSLAAGPDRSFTRPAAPGDKELAHG